MWLRRNNDLNKLKTDFELLNSKVDGLLISLPEKEKALIQALEYNAAADAQVLKLIQDQESSISILKLANAEKKKELTGLTKWIILAVLGLLGVSSKYHFEFERGTGLIVKPDPNAGLIIPIVYTVAIIAVATGHDSKIGGLIEKMGEKIGT